MKISLKIITPLLLLFKQSSRYLALIAVVISIIYGCTPSEKSENTTTSNNQDQLEAIQKKPLPKNHIVEIKKMKFVPSSIEARIGDKITFVNMGMFSHDITEEINKKWTSGVLESGASWSMTVEEEVSYYCNLHVIMKGKINVKKY